jgi:hypothetical protein
MPRAVSIHIGVNQPDRRGDLRATLEDSETAAWRMAELAWQAGYDSMVVLRGAAATLAAVHSALLNASQLLQEGDTLLVTYSGHGGQVPDADLDDRTGYDQKWSLHDDELLDDDLYLCWRLFRPGVRIVVVSESCYSGGIARGGDEDDVVMVPRRRRVRYRGEPEWAKAMVAEARASCVAPPSRDTGDVKATVLLLTATRDNERSRGDLFTRCLLEVWDRGAFSGSYCELYERVKRAVHRENPLQVPQILMVGKPDPDFARQPAFRRAEPAAEAREPAAQAAAPREGVPPPAPAAGQTDAPREDDDDDEWYDRGRRRPVVYR